MLGDGGNEGGGLLAIHQPGAAGLGGGAVQGGFGGACAGHGRGHLWQVMSEHASPLLFEAISRPQQSLNRTGMRVVAVVLVLGFGLSGLLFTLLGAWPVLGFAGAELALVLGLFVLHRRWAGRCIERISLSHDQLRILRIDGQGRAYEAVLEPYWARLRVEEGAAARLMIGQRGQESEIGLYLNEDEKRDLARALTAALGRYREPRFDNPQLR